MKPSALGAFSGDVGVAKVEAGICAAMAEAAASAIRIAAMNAICLLKRVFMTVRVYGVLINQRCFSLLESDLARVAKLLPTAQRTSGPLVIGTAFGMIRQLPSAS